MVRLVNDDRSGSVLLWGRQNERVLGIREEMMRKRAESDSLEMSWKKW